MSEWRYYWPRWNEFLAEAGLVGGAPTGRRADEDILDALIPLIRLSRGWPTSAEIRIYAREHPGFPSEITISARGNRSEIASNLIDYCQGRDGLQDVVEICKEVVGANPPDEASESGSAIRGFVYLMKQGKFYKLGKTTSPNRRHKEIGLLLPDPTHLVHAIPTDDPSGIEVYWKNRSKDKHHDGEFYRLGKSDVMAFNRRKTFM